MQIYIAYYIHINIRYICNWWIAEDLFRYREVFLSNVKQLLLMESK